MPLTPLARYALRPGPGASTPFTPPPPGSPSHSSSPLDPDAPLQSGSAHQRHPSPCPCQSSGPVPFPVSPPHPPPNKLTSALVRACIALSGLCPPGAGKQVNPSFVSAPVSPHRLSRPLPSAALLLCCSPSVARPYPVFPPPPQPTQPVPAPSPLPPPHPAPPPHHSPPARLSVLGVPPSLLLFFFSFFSSSTNSLNHTTLSTSTGLPARYSTLSYRPPRCVLWIPLAREYSLSSAHPASPSRKRAPLARLQPLLVDSLHCHISFHTRPPFRLRT